MKLWFIVGLGIMLPTMDASRARVVAGPDVWQVRAASKVGSAILIDRRGYFLTASHNVHTGTGADAYEKAAKATVSYVTTDGENREFEASVLTESDRCKSLASRSEGGNCDSGLDMVLLKAAAFPAPSIASYRVHDLNLSPLFRSTHRRIRGATLFGYGTEGLGSSVSRSGDLFLKRSGSISLYAGSIGITHGYSGGPALDPVSGRVVAITYRGLWKDLDIKDTFEIPSNAVEALPVAYLWPVIKETSAIEMDPEMEVLEKAVRSGQLTAQELGDRIAVDSTTNLQFVQLVRLIFSDNSKPAPPERLVEELFAACSARSLTNDCADIPFEYSSDDWTRRLIVGVEAARALRDNDDPEFVGTRLAGVAYDALSPSTLRAAAKARVDVTLFSEASLELGLRYRKEGAVAEAAKWISLSYSLEPTPEAGRELADTMEVGGNDHIAALLYADVYRDTEQPTFSQFGLSHGEGGTSYGFEDINDRYRLALTGVDESVLARYPSLVQFEISEYRYATGLRNELSERLQVALGPDGIAIASEYVGSS